MATYDIGSLIDLPRRIDERLAQHRDNLRLWESGWLSPTEPDEREQECVMRELRAAIAELEGLRAKIRAFVAPPTKFLGNCGACGGPVHASCSSYGGTDGEPWYCSSMCWTKRSKKEVKHDI